MSVHFEIESIQHQIEMMIRGGETSQVIHLLKELDFRTKAYMEIDHPYTHKQHAIFHEVLKYCMRMGIDLSDLHRPSKLKQIAKNNKEAFDMDTKKAREILQQALNFPREGMEKIVDNIKTQQIGTKSTNLESELQANEQAHIQQASQMQSMWSKRENTPLTIPNHDKLIFNTMLTDAETGEGLKEHYPLRESVKCNNIVDLVLKTYSYIWANCDKSGIIEFTRDKNNQISRQSPFFSLLSVPMRTTIAKSALTQEVCKIGEAAHFILQHTSLPFADGNCAAYTKPDPEIYYSTCSMVFPERIFWCPLPTIRTNHIGQLHSADNELPAIEIEGSGVYALSGHILPDSIAGVTEKGTVAKILMEDMIKNESNQSLINEIIDFVGWDQILPYSHHGLFNSWREYELYRAKMPDEPLEFSKVLKMTCPSTGHIHYNRVAPWCQTAEQAIFWMNHNIHPDAFVVQT